MPYTPPAGNAANFNFSGSLYLRPPGNSIIFNFGGTIGPISTDVNLPTGMRQARLYEDDWFWAPRRAFAPPFIQTLVFPKPMRPLDCQILGDPEHWTMPRRIILATPLFPSRRRTVLFTVT